MSVAIVGRFGSDFPWSTLTVNVIGSFLIGLIATLIDEMGYWGPQVRVFLIVGVLGGFTTFSSFSLETLRLVEGEQPGRAVGNIVLSLALTLAACLLGVAVGRTLERA
jgi:CrcB protein